MCVCVINDGRLHDASATLERWSSTLTTEDSSRGTPKNLNHGRANAQPCQCFSPVAPLERWKFHACIKYTTRAQSATERRTAVGQPTCVTVVHHYLTSMTQKDTANSARCPPSGTSRQHTFDDRSPISTTTKLGDISYRQPICSVVHPTWLPPNSSRPWCIHPSRWQVPSKHPAISATSIADTLTARSWPRPYKSTKLTMIRLSHGSGCTPYLSIRNILPEHRARRCVQIMGHKSQAATSKERLWS